MDFLLTYVLQVNLLLVIVYLGYALLLKNLTFYQINRAYFIVGVGFSFLYPFLDIKALFRQHIEPMGEVIHYIPEFFVEQPVGTSVFTLNNLLLIVLAVGSGIFIIRLLMQLLSLLRIHLKSEPAVWKSFIYRNVLFPIVPFSFFNKIYINKQQHEERELLDIFKHEDIHVKGRHTFDILFTEIVLITCWYNPVVWLIRKAVRQNLEFLTDQQVLDKGVDRQVYQYSLLNVSKQGANAAIANQFNFKMLKRRIMMMNKKRSSRLELSKYAFLIPVFVFVAGAFTVSKADDKIIEVVGYAKSTDMAKVLHKPEVEKDAADVPMLDKDTIESAAADISISSDRDTSRAPRIVIRGTSVHEGEKPLFVLDGKEMGSDYRMTHINPEEIESINVFKDSSVAHLYGDKGKNGVIVITTKGTNRQLEKERKDTSEIVAVGYRIDKDTTKKLQGKVSGVKIRSVGGKLLDSLGNEMQPLFVVDGEPIPNGMNINHINPNDIESISVLKDATSTALYGDKGKDGVILITTKDGRGPSKDGDGTTPRITVKGQATVQQKVDRSRLIDEITVIGYSSDDLPKPQVDVEPEPEGGLAEFRKWVGMNYQYPEEAIKAGVKGTIMVSFVVEMDGSLSNIKVTQDLGYGTGKSAIDLFKKSPKWLPGIVNGKGIRVQYSFPITLDLQSS